MEFALLLQSGTACGGTGKFSIACPLQGLPAGSSSGYCTSFSTDVDASLLPPGPDLPPVTRQLDTVGLYPIVSAE